MLGLLEKVAEGSPAKGQLCSDPSRAAECGTKNSLRPKCKMRKAASTSLGLTLRGRQDVGLSTRAQCAPLLEPNAIFGAQ